MSSKEATGEPQSYNLKLTLDILDLMMKSKNDSQECLTVVLKLLLDVMEVF